MQAAWRGGGNRAVVGSIGLDDIREAQARIAGIAQRTPMKASHGLRERLGTPVFLKLETLQATGAFKLRGAANHLLSLSESERRRGVITVSTGNHGRAVAYVAQRLSIRCVVCLSSLVPPNKIDRLATGPGVVSGTVDPTVINEVRTGLPALTHRRM